MIINGITVPEESSKVDYIADPIGGWMYVVTTSVSVSQKRLDAMQQELTDAESVIEKAQATIDALAPQIEAFRAAAPTVAPLTLSAEAGALDAMAAMATSTPAR